MNDDDIVRLVDDALAEQDRMHTDRQCACRGIDRDAGCVMAAEVRRLRVLLKGDDPGLLTAEEYRLVELLGDVAESFAELDRLPAAADGDIAEIVAHVHDLQARVLARAVLRHVPTRAATGC